MNVSCLEIDPDVAAWLDVSQLLRDDVEFCLLFGGATCFHGLHATFWDATTIPALPYLPLPIDP